LLWGRFLGPAESGRKKLVRDRRPTQLWQIVKFAHRLTPDKMEIRSSSVFFSASIAGRD
jgi:hypothetical protein